MINPIKVFTLAMKLLTNIGATILQVAQFLFTKYLHFDKAHCYNEKFLKPQDFADDKWHKKDDELFADPTDILDTDELIFELNSIHHKGFGINPYSKESRSSSPLSDIPDSVGDEEEKNNNDTPDNQLRKEIEKRSHLQLNKRDRDSSIQLSDIFHKRSRQERLTNPNPRSRQSTRIKDKTTKSANFVCSASTTPSASKSFIDMVKVLTNLNAGYDYYGLDEPFFFKEAIASLYLKIFEKAIYAEFQSVIENHTWEYKNTPSG